MVTLAQVWETQTYPFSWPRRRRHHVRADGFHLLAVQSSLWFGRSMTFSKRTRWVICERWFLSGDWTWILPSTTWNLKLIFGTTVLVDPTETLRAYKLERGRSLVVENPRPSTAPSPSAVCAQLLRCPASKDTAPSSCARTSMPTARTTHGDNLPVITFTDSDEIVSRDEQGCFYHIARWMVKVGMGLRWKWSRYPPWVLLALNPAMW